MKKKDAGRGCSLTENVNTHLTKKVWQDGVRTVVKCLVELLLGLNSELICYFN